MGDLLLNFIGIARRAGKLTIGADPVRESIEKKKAKLILTANDVSKNTYKDMLREAEKSGVELLILNRTKEEISYALGKTTAVMAVEDEGFVKKIKELNSADK